MQIESDQYGIDQIYLDLQEFLEIRDGYLNAKLEDLSPTTKESSDTAQALIRIRKIKKLFYQLMPELKNEGPSLLTIKKEIWNEVAHSFIGKPLSLEMINRAYLEHLPSLRDQFTDNEYKVLENLEQWMISEDE